jgi:hypothetical protein
MRVLRVGYINSEITEEADSMDSTRDFVAKIKDTQDKAKKNKQHNGEGSPGAKLPNKQHSTDK